MKKIILSLIIVFSVTLLLNFNGVSASGASYVAMNGVSIPASGSYASATRYKEKEESQLLDVIDTTREMRAAIYTSSGYQVSPTWLTFNGESLVWFNRSNEKYDSSLWGENLRVRIGTTSIFFGGTLWAFWLPDPSRYGY